MTTNRVRKNGLYVFIPVLMDADMSQHKYSIVRVIELPGCPRSKMPKCFAHVELMHTHTVIGMVHTNSLRKVTRKEIADGIYRGDLS